MLDSPEYVYGDRLVDGLHRRRLLFVPRVVRTDPHVELAVVAYVPRVFRHVGREGEHLGERGACVRGERTGNVRGIGWWIIRCGIDKEGGGGALGRQVGE